MVIVPVESTLRMRSVGGIGDVEVARPVHRHAPGVSEMRLDRRASVPAETRYSGPSNGGDRSRRIHLADAVAESFEDVEVARPVHRHARGVAHHHAYGFAHLHLRTHDRGDRPGGVHLADGGLVSNDTGDVEVARPVHRHVRGVSEMRLDRRASVPADTDIPRPRNSGDRSGGVHLADALVVRIGDVEVADPVHRHALGDSEKRLDRRASVPDDTVIIRPSPSNGGDRSRRIHLADAYSTGTIITIAGTGKEGLSGDGGPAVEAHLRSPYDVAVDEAGNVYIADRWNSRIRKVDSTGTITTIAGTGRTSQGVGKDGFSGDGGPAVEAHLNYPEGVAVDGAGNVYIADTGNHRIRKVDSTGTITTIAKVRAVDVAVDVGGQPLRRRFPHSQGGFDGDDHDHCGDEGLRFQGGRVAGDRGEAQWRQRGGGRGRQRLCRRHWESPHSSFDVGDGWCWRRGPVGLYRGGP